MDGEGGNYSMVPSNIIMSALKHVALLTYWTYKRREEKEKNPWFLTHAEQLHWGQTVMVVSYHGLSHLWLPTICIFIQIFLHNICVSLRSLRASLFADWNSSLDLTARRVMRIYSLWKAIISHFSNLNNHMRALILFNLKVQKGVHAGYFMSIRVNLSGLIALRGGLWINTCIVLDVRGRKKFNNPICTWQKIKRGVQGPPQHHNQQHLLLLSLR